MVRSFPQVPAVGVLGVDLKQLQVVLKYASAERVDVARVYVSEVGDVVSFGVLPGGCVFAAEVEVVEQQVQGEDQFEVQEHQSYCVKIE